MVLGRLFVMGEASQASTRASSRAQNAGVKSGNTNTPGDTSTSARKE
jgi:hypothetical protein